MIKITREINGHMTETLEFSELSELIAYEAQKESDKLLADEAVAKQKIRDAVASRSIKDEPETIDVWVGASKDGGMQLRVIEDPLRGNIDCFKKFTWTEVKVSKPK